MLFAQTGTASPLPRKNADAEVNPYLIALWWIVPLVLAAILIAIKVRSNQLKENAKQRLRQADATAKEQKKSLTHSVLVDSEPTANQSTSARVPAADGQPKKKKKDKEKEKTKGKPNLLPSTATSAATASPAVATGDGIASTQTTEVQASMVGQAVTEPKPSNAIFEPLRDASRGRRKVYNDASFDSRERDNSLSKENDAYNQIFGGKFERIVPKQTLRSVANRWPTTETQPAKKPQPALPTPQPSPPVSATPVASSDDATPQVQAAASEPTKGLKSFVSKIKSSPDSQSEDN